MKKKVVIVGCSGMESLILAKQLKDVCDVSLVIKGKIGQSVLEDTPIYLKPHNDMILFLKENEIEYSTFSIKAGILLRQKVFSADAYRKLGEAYRDRIEKDFYRKSRLLEPTSETKKGIIDFEFNTTRKVLRIAPEIFLENICLEITSLKRFINYVVKIEKNRIILNDDTTIPFDILLINLPLWDLKQIAFWEILFCYSTKRCLFSIKDYGESCFNSKIYDVIYTPFTPENKIYKISIDGEKCLAECSGEYESQKNKIISDLNFLFESNWSFLKIHENLGGYIQEQKINFLSWPKNIIPFGKYTIWNNRESANSVFKKISLVKEMIK
jgi:hypothetical protein